MFVPIVKFLSESFISSKTLLCQILWRLVEHILKFTIYISFPGSDYLL